MTRMLSINLANIKTKLTARCVDANGAYDVLLGMAWLRNTNTEAQFGTSKFKLGGVVCVQQ